MYKYQLLFSVLMVLGLAMPLGMDAYAEENQDIPEDSLDIYKEIVLDRVTVVGQPAWINEIPGAASYISSQEIEKQNYSDVNRVLRRIPGVYFQEEDGYGLRPNIGLRGTDVTRSSKISIMEDGVLIAPAPYAAPAAYYTPTAGRMSSFEVRKGSSQIKYGPNTNGGALNYRSTEIPSSRDINADLSLGETSHRKIHANVGNTHGNFGYLAETYQQQTNGFKELDGGGNTGFNTQDYLGKLMYRTDAIGDIFHQFELKMSHYDEISNETYLGLTDSDFNENPYRRYAGSQVDEMDAEHTKMMLRHFAMFSDNVDLTTTLYRNDFARNWYKLDQVAGVGIADMLAGPQQHSSAYDIARGENSGDDALMVKANNREYISRGVQTKLNYSFKAGITESELEFGARLHQDEMDRYQWVDGYRMEEGVMVRSSEGEPGTESNRIESADALAFYVQNEITVGDWIVTPGIRYEHIEMKREDFGSDDPGRTGSDLTLNETTLDVIVPGIGVNYQLTEDVNVFGGVHKGFSPPAPSADNQTDAEESVNYELGSRFARDNLHAEITGFLNDYSNLLGNDLAAGGGAGTTDQFNAGEVTVSGVEFALGYTLFELFGEVDAPLSLSYTFTDSDFRNDFESNSWGVVQEGDEIPYLPKHQFNGSVSLERGDLTLSFDGFATSAMRTTAGSGEITSSQNTDAYVVLDGSADYRISERASVFVNLRNITDATYIVARRPAGVRPGLPRTFMGGLRLNL